MNKKQVAHELKTLYWDHVHNWDYIEANIDKVVRYTGCSADILRELMQQIEQKYPAPVAKRKEQHTATYQRCASSTESRKRR